MSMIGIGADLDAVYTTLDDGKTPSLGDVFWGTGGKVYKFIQYDEATAAVDGVAGEVAYYVADTGYGASVVTSDLSDSDEIGAGVLQASLSQDEYGWIQIKGGATLSIALTAGADGDILTPTGAGDGTLDVNVATAASTHICAFAVDADQNEIICDFPF
jgi:hypothetical protein